jgi:hypothetical protein
MVEKMNMLPSSSGKDARFSAEWAKFSPVIVAPVEGGMFSIIDGQHRATAAMLRGIEKVPCEIVHIDRARQAEAFAAINGNITRVSCTGGLLRTSDREGSRG